MTKTTTALLAVIALGVVVIAGVLLAGVLDGGEPKESPARQDAREDARQEARIYCSLGATSTDSPEFQNCVKSEVRDALTAWGREHQD